MTLSTVDFDSRSDAIIAAEFAGYDVSSVRVTCDRDNGRYQWELRSFDVALDGDGETPSGSDAAADVVADMVAGLGDALDAPVLTDIVVAEGWTHVDGGEVAVDTGAVSGAGSVVEVDKAVDTGTAVADAPVASVQPVAVAGDLVMQVFGAMPASALTMFAQSFADKHMAIVTLRDAVTFEVASVVTPGMGKVARTRVVSSGTGAGAVRAPIEHVETIIDRIKRGVWLDSEVSLTNLSILKLKHAIEEAASAGDIGKLESLGGFKSTSTYYNHARAYLNFHIADAPRRAAALDAEFGYGALTPVA